MTQIVEIRCLEDLDCADQKVGLPVGPRIGRSKEKKEWYVLLHFLRATIPSGLIELPIKVRNGIPPDEPDFVMARSGSTVGLFEVTEATVKDDQKEMTESERSGKTATMPGEFGGRFARGASRPELPWATDIVDAIRRKGGKKIFEDSNVARHLLIYPNSNASRLLSDEDHEREAVNVLRAEIAKDAAALSKMANGCLAHVLGAYLLCFDALGEMRVLQRHETTDVFVAESNPDELLESAIFIQAWANAG